ncbi:shikimate dehydrogenase family protein [Blattabacterium cuenoti]|uniref:shikimate dehydrogenase family protein n=1 Tax=Blattabacterium cuenoti TaxID=1653831 RepID=UPI00163C0BEE|nr:shikimate dehydrogenase [Blattabacterium cuenoti]
MKIEKFKKSVFGLVGKKISYSFSKNFFLEKFKNESIFHATYEIFDIPKIEDVLWIFKIPYFRGCNVTIPYKTSIIPFLTEVDLEAKSIGSVNVVKIEDDSSIIGYNTDILGFEYSFLKDMKKFSYENARALILGTGGVSNSISFILNKLKIQYKYVSRTRTKTKRNKEVLRYEELDKDLMKNHKIIINCTPLGTYPMINFCPLLPYKYISSSHYLYDVIYNPYKTLFLKKGEEKGAMIKNGLEMLHIQAEESWKIWNS